MFVRQFRPRVSFPCQMHPSAIRRCNSTNSRLKKYRGKRLRFKIWDDMWGHFKRVHIAGKVVSAIVLGSFSLYLWQFAGKKEAILPPFGSADESIMSAFEDGRGVK